MILADEPVASLDPATAASVLSLLREVARERGITVVCSLHQVDFAHSFADRVVNLSDGRIAGNSQVRIVGASAWAAAHDDQSSTPAEQ